MKSEDAGSQFAPRLILSPLACNCESWTRTSISAFRAPRPHQLNDLALIRREERGARREGLLLLFHAPLSSSLLPRAC